MQQPTLFSMQSVIREPDICRNRHRRSDTSMLADATVNKERDREQVFGLIKDAKHYGHTTDEISVLLDRPCNCVSGRMSELKRAGRIVGNGVRRPTRMGRLANVYVVA